MWKSAKSFTATLFLSFSPLGFREKRREDVWYFPLLSTRINTRSDLSLIPRSRFSRRESLFYQISMRVFLRWFFPFPLSPRFISLSDVVFQYAWPDCESKKDQKILSFFPPSSHGWTNSYFWDKRPWVLFWGFFFLDFRRFKLEMKEIKGTFWHEEKKIAIKMSWMTIPPLSPSWLRSSLEMSETSSSHPSKNLRAPVHRTSADRAANQAI